MRDLMLESMGYTLTDAVRALFVTLNIKTSEGGGSEL